MSETTALVSVFSSPELFDNAQRVAKLMSASELVPAQYRDGAKGIANCVIALDIAQQLRISPLTVMQNLQIVEGVPGWKTTYLIERFAQAGIEPEYEFEKRGKKKVSYDIWTGPKGERRKETRTTEVEDRACRFKCQRNGKESIGPWVSLEDAIREGWYNRNGSKWATMPDHMLMIAAARTYNKFYPVVFLGNIPTEDELTDWEPSPSPVDDLNNRFSTQDEYIDVEPASDIDDEELI